jgi:hypothetical protein
MEFSNLAIKEAEQWQIATQLRELFITILIHYEVNDPLKLWEENWRGMSDDILRRQRRILQHPELELNEDQIRN